MRLAFLVSRSSFERLAAQMEAGEHVSLPRWAGLSYVRDAGLNRNGVAYLWGPTWPSGSEGIVHCREDQVRQNFNVFWTFELSSDWQFLSDD